jgi:hypothetical protein
MTTQEPKGGYSEWVHGVTLSHQINGELDKPATELPKRMLNGANDPSYIIRLKANDTGLIETRRLSTCDRWQFMIGASSNERTSSGSNETVCGRNL